MLDVVHFRLDVEERLKRAARLLEHAASRMRETVLRQIADGERCGSNDAARIRLFEASQDLQQRGFASAVRPAQADAVTVVDLPGDVVEQDAVAEGLGEVGELDHAAGKRLTATVFSLTAFVQKT